MWLFPDTTSPVYHGRKATERKILYMDTYEIAP